MTAVDEIVGALAANGRTVDHDTIARELAGLGGLAESQAVATVLACYGLTPDGTPTRTFAPDFSDRASIAAVLREGRPAVAFTLIAAVLAVVPALLVPLIVRFFVDRYLVAGREVVGPYVVVGLVLAAVMAVSLVALQYAVLRRSYLRMSATGQTTFEWHILRMRVDDLQQQSPGTVIARMNAAQRGAFQGGMLLPLAMVNVISALAFAGALLMLDPLIFAVAVLSAAFVLISSLWILKARSRTQVANDEAMSQLSGIAADTVAAVESVKAAAWEQFAFARWARARQRWMITQSNLGVSNQWLVFGQAVGLALGLGLVLAVGTWQVIDGDLTLGTLVASQFFVALFLESVGLLAYAGVLTQMAASANRQADEILRQPLDPESLDPVHPAPVGNLAGEVRIAALTFGYDPDQPPLISDLDLHIPAGRRVALVGASGSGKTTIARLVTGELRPWSGHVEFDGVPRLRIGRQVLAAGIAYVPQRPVLFAGTIRDNLTMWDPLVDDADIRRAARDACIEDTILARPGGYYAEVTGDAGFSGGQLQRLAIARALVGNPAVLILDEATSALDPLVEADVEANLRRRGCTSLVVAHRLSTIRDADEILVISHGCVVQQGTFDQLKDEGLFSELLHG